MNWFQLNAFVTALFCAGLTACAAGAAEHQRGVDKATTSGTGTNASPPTNNNPPPNRSVRSTRNHDGPEGSRRGTPGTGIDVPDIPTATILNPGKVVPSYNVTIPTKVPPSVSPPVPNIPTTATIGSPAAASIPTTAAVAGSAVVASVTDALSYWHICNRSEEEVMKLTVILGDGDNLVGSGWHNLEPQHCLVSRIASRTGYYFATAGQGQNWGGRTDLCASLTKWKGSVPRDCPDGFQKLPFKRVSLDKSEVFSDLK